MSNFFKFAENILNNLDQTTQSSIQTALVKNNTNKSEHKSLKSKSQVNKFHNNDSSSDSNEIASKALISSHSTASLKTNNTTSSSSAYQLNTAGGFKSLSSNNSTSNLWHPPKSAKEDELIDFLNSNDMSDLSEPMLNSKASLEIADPNESSLSINDNDVQFLVGTDNKSKHSETEDEASISELNEFKETTTRENESNAKEKALLKGEIKSLNQEIQSLLKRTKTIEDG